MPEVSNFLLDAKNGVRFYSLARYALLQALQSAGVKKDTKVLLPSYICCELLAPILFLQAIPVWYDLDEQLQPFLPPEDWPSAEVVLAVNYFGFPQNLEPFYDYAARAEAILIEDNAHGFLSRDNDGKWLGTRAPLNLFSMRKTLRISDGAALLVNDPEAQKSLPHQLPFDGSGFSSAQLYKARLRHIPIIGDSLLSASTALVRGIRRLRTGSELPQKDPDLENRLPPIANPWRGLREALFNLDVEAEITRRRKAYLEFARVSVLADVDPVFKGLPAYCAPYGFPFRSGESGLQIIQGFADENGFDLITWPDLPGKIVEGAPEHYRNVFLVNFLW